MKTSFLIQRLKFEISNVLRTKEPSYGFKVRAYKTAIANLESSGIETITSFDDIKHIPGIGKGIKELTLKALDATPSQQFNKQDAYDALMDIHGIGQIKAMELVDKHGIRTIDDLQKNKHLLNEKQLLGLEFAKNYIKRISREEMVKHEAIIKKYTKGISGVLDVQIAGSYRRGLATSGDIDVIMSSEDSESLEKLVTVLKQKGYIMDRHFAQGKHKFLGLAKLPICQTWRRIDIILTPPETFPYALMYFTGSKIFNIKTRQRALDIGYSLNERGMTHLKTKEPVKGLKSERDIMKFLGYEYVKPVDRC